LSWAFLGVLGLAAILAALFAWSLYGARGGHLDTWPDERSSQDNPAHFSPIRQCLSEEDISFLEARGSPRLARRARAERRAAAILYVEALHGDFRKVLQVGRQLALLSPEVAGEQEAERFWIAVRFECRYQMVRGLLRLGASPLEQLERMTEVVGVFSHRLDMAIAALGEQAALALGGGQRLSEGE